MISVTNIICNNWNDQLIISLKILKTKNKLNLDLLAMSEINF